MRAHFRNVRSWWAQRPHLPPLAAMVEAAVVAVVLATFLVLGRLYSSPWIVALDEAGLALGRSVRSGELDRIMQILSDFGTDFLWIIWIAVAILLVVLQRFPSAAALAVVSLGVHPWNDLLKTLYQRARPTEWGSGAQAFSFPSGHAMAAGAVYGLLALIAWRELRGPARWFGVSSCIGLAVLVGLSRPYLGVHYPSDVLAGLLAGALWANFVVVGWRLTTRITRRHAAELPGGNDVAQSVGPPGRSHPGEVA
jgi:membrane-associated phospholipid phosphatase